MKKLVLFQGDSVTDAGRKREIEEVQYFQNALGCGYPSLVAARYQVDHARSQYDFLNRAISGNRVVDLYARWKIDAINLNPAILSILIGVNDTWHEWSRQNGVEIDRAEKIYRMLLNFTRERLPDVKLVLCEPFVLQTETGVVKPEWVTELRRRSEYTRRLAKEFNALFVPFQADLEKAAEAAGDPAVILHDGVHPTLVGHQVLADTWLREVGKLLD